MSYLYLFWLLFVLYEVQLDNNDHNYSAIVSFYHIRSREGAKYKAVIQCSVLV